MKNQQKYIANTLISKITKIQRDEQMKENIKRGRKGKAITFIDASNILARLIR